VAHTWETLIGNGKLGYMALLRNLRNILEADVSAEAMTQVCATLANRAAVARSKQLPFRFLAAFREVTAARRSPKSRKLSCKHQAERPGNKAEPPAATN